MIDILPTAGSGSTTLADLTIRGARAPRNFGVAGDSGGGIQAQSPLVLTNVVVIDDDAADGSNVGVTPGHAGGAGGDGGGWWSDAAVTITGAASPTTSPGTGTRARAQGAAWLLRVALRHRGARAIYTSVARSDPASRT